MPHEKDDHDFDLPQYFGVSSLKLADQTTVRWRCGFGIGTIKTIIVGRYADRKTAVEVYTLSILYLASKNKLFSKKSLNYEVISKFLPDDFNVPTDHYNNLTIDADIAAMILESFLESLHSRVNTGEYETIDTKALFERLNKKIETINLDMKDSKKQKSLIYLVKDNRKSYELKEPSSKVSFTPKPKKTSLINEVNVTRVDDSKIFEPKIIVKLGKPTTYIGVYFVGRGTSNARFDYLNTYIDLGWYRNTEDAAIAYTLATIYAFKYVKNDIKHRWLDFEVIKPALSSSMNQGFHITEKFDFTLEIADQILEYFKLHKFDLYMKALTKVKTVVSAFESVSNISESNLASKDVSVKLRIIESESAVLSRFAIDDDSSDNISEWKKMVGVSDSDLGTCNFNDFDAFSNTLPDNLRNSVGEITTSTTTTTAQDFEWYSKAAPSLLDSSLRTKQDIRIIVLPKKDKGYLGTYYLAKTNNWNARISYRDVYIDIGRYADQHEAAIAFAISTIYLSNKDGDLGVRRFSRSLDFEIIEPALPLEIRQLFNRDKKVNLYHDLAVVILDYLVSLKPTTYNKVLDKVKIKIDSIISAERLKSSAASGSMQVNNPDEKYESSISSTDASSSVNLEDDLLPDGLFSYELLSDNKFNIDEFEHSRPSTPELQWYSDLDFRATTSDPGLDKELNIIPDSTLPEQKSRKKHKPN